MKRNQVPPRKKNVKRFFFLFSILKTFTESKTRRLLEECLTAALMVAMLAPLSQPNEVMHYEHLGSVLI